MRNVRAGANCQRSRRVGRVVIRKCQPWLTPRLPWLTSGSTCVPR
jgi:hypothetical protein